MMVMERYLFLPFPEGMVLGQNLREHLQRLLDQNRCCLPFIEDMAVKSSQTSAN